MISYFDNFPSDIEAIGLNLSGGTDSALLFYMLLKTIRDRGLRTKVYAIHGYDAARPFDDSWGTAEKVYDWIVDKFPTVKIQQQIAPLFIFPFYKDKDVNKELYAKPVLLYMQRRYNLTEVIFGDTLGMPDSPRPVDTDLIQLQKQNPLRYPIAHLNKQFVAEQYLLLGIEELSTITASCVGIESPCKSCWWCEERKWAFGTYDGAVD